MFFEAEFVQTATTNPIDLGMPYGLDEDFEPSQGFIPWTEFPEDGFDVPFISVASANALYETAGTRDLITWLAEQIAEWGIDQALDRLFGGTQPDQTVVWQPNTNPGLSRTEGQLSDFFRDSTMSSAVIPTGANDFFSFVHNANGSTEAFYHFDTDNDGGADMLYHQKTDGSWERAEFVDAVGDPIWVPSHDPNDQRERERRQDED